jgi:hypothetical protein
MERYTYYQTILTFQFSDTENERGDGVIVDEEEASVLGSCVKLEKGVALAWSSSVRARSRLTLRSTLKGRKMM